MPELRRDVAELHAGREELRRERVAQILHRAVPDAGALQNPPPIAVTEVARIDPVEHE